MVIIDNIPKDIKDALAKVYDPEIPVLSLMDMGVIRSVEVNENVVLVKLTPTYSACPAMDTMADDVKKILKEIGYEVNVKLVLSPAWTTDWISPNGRKALEKYGIAAPLNEHLDKRALIDGERIVNCPQCHSTNTKLISQFGSTACKALFQCEDCLEAFDYFKCLK